MAFSVEWSIFYWTGWKRAGLWCGRRGHAPRSLSSTSCSWLIGTFVHSRHATCGGTVKRQLRGQSDLRGGLAAGVVTHHAIACMNLI